MEEVKNKYAVWAYWLGITIVFGSHLYMLGFSLPANQMVPHAVLNLVAGCFLAYSWFKR